MKILALIPARGGSKRLPGKNIKRLDGLPLIAWTILAAHRSRVCDSVVVSTDDPAIAAVATEHGAKVPKLRPAELADDKAGSVDVVLHELDQYELSHGPVDGVLLLQPTSPFRRAESIRAAVEKFASLAGARPVVSVTPAVNHPAWCFKSNAEGMVPYLGWEKMILRSQDLAPAWVLNGAIYVISPQRLRESRTFLTTDFEPLMMEAGFESIDIDTQADWDLAELLLQRFNEISRKMS